MWAINEACQDIIKVPANFVGNFRKIWIVYLPLLSDMIVLCGFHNLFVFSFHLFAFSKFSKPTLSDIYMMRENIF